MRKRFFIIIFLLIMIVLGLGITYSAFTSENKLIVNQHIASFIFEANQTDHISLALSDLKPGDEISYNFSVSNNKTVDDKVYTPYSNGIVNINLDNKTSGNLVIDTYINNSKITGNYSFYVCAYNSYDGINYNLVNLTECINVPLNIVDNYKVDYNFEINIKGEDRIFIKDQDKTLNFEMLYQSEIENPNIRVSLYEKNELTAYNQSYSLVDLGDYIYDELSLIDNKTYKLSEDIVSSSEYENYSLSFKNSMFKLNGYKLVFDLYDGDIKVGTIEKKFIVKGER